MDMKGQLKGTDNDVEIKTMISSLEAKIINLAQRIRSIEEDNNDDDIK